MNKALLRAQCRAWRGALTAEQVASASAKLCKGLAGWPTFWRSDTVMTYLAFGNEISLMPLMERFPAKRWVIPQTLVKPEPHLILHPYDPARLVRHKFGMLEPDAALPVIEPRELELVLVPGVAFDRRGYRLGFGGGFYDRFLPHVTATTVGIVYAALVVGSVPSDEFDRRVEWLASEQSICPAEQ